MQLSVTEIAEVVSARIVAAPNPDAQIASVTWDSRTAGEGSLYVALAGERVDGHDFVLAAVSAGARCVLVTRALPDEMVARVQELGAAVLLVDDAQKAITDLACAWRGRLRGRVVGLTGSNGKTTTKNLVRDVLSCAGSVTATRGNQNNELGVPNTLLAADADTLNVVVEMGMRGLGQIESLCSFVRPEWGIVTQVGESHIELLGSRENIARAKSELIAALPEGGIAFLNGADDMSDFVWECAQGAERGVGAVCFDGSGAHREDAVAGWRAGRAVWASDISLDDAGCASFTLFARGFSDGAGCESAICSLALSGLHNVHNACAAAAVGLAAGLSLEVIVEALGAAKPESGRQEMLTAREGFTVVNDAYNANPDSMRAALNTFAAMHVTGSRIAVLGDMGELGDFGPAGHREMGALAAALGIDRLVSVGDLGSLIAEAAEEGGMPEDRVFRTADAAGALEVVKGLVGPGDAVLVKASHSVGLERVVEGLVD